MKMRFFVVMLLSLLLASCASEAVKPNGNLPSESITPHETLSEEATEAETEDLFENLEVEGHTIRKMAAGLYCIEPGIQNKPSGDGQVVISTVSLSSLEDFRNKLLNGGFTEEEYTIMNGWPKTSYGKVIPDPNHLCDVLLPEGWHSGGIMWEGALYSYFMGPDNGNGGGSFHILPSGQFKRTYDNVYSSSTYALVKKEGTSGEGSFNGIPCMVYEHLAGDNVTLVRTCWLDLSAGTEELYVGMTFYPEETDTHPNFELVGKTAEGIEYLVTFSAKGDAESLKVYTADFFRSFRPAPLK